MSSARGRRDPFLCSICLDVFSEPVSTPCGHNFCKDCISQTWEQSQRSFCPLCKDNFNPKPELKTNTLLRDMVLQQKHEAKPVSTSDVCESQRQPHVSDPPTTPLDNMKDTMCPKHQRPLELFCITEQCCVCSMCTLLQHKTHDLLSLEEACEHSRTALEQTVAENQRLEEKRRLKVQEIQRCLDVSQSEANRETIELDQVFTNIMETVKKCLHDNTNKIEQTQHALKKQAELQISELKQEISELERSSIEAQKIFNLTDPLQFLQHCPAVRPSVNLKDWNRVSVEPPTYTGSVKRALSELEQTLSMELRVKKYNINKTLSDSALKSKAFTEKAFMSKRAELRRMQYFAVDITLDPATAHPELVVSRDLKQVHHSDSKKWLIQPSPHRFDRCANVLGKQSFSTGKAYFEVQVQGKTDCDIGVAQVSMKRKGAIIASPKHGQWSICLRRSSVYSACTEPWTPLSLHSVPQRIGVFVDYEAGLVSFYDVDTADLIYCFTDCYFRDKLLPLLSPCNSNRGTNCAPLIISTVRPL